MRGGRKTGTGFLTTHGQPIAAESPSGTEGVAGSAGGRTWRPGQ